MSRAPAPAAAARYYRYYDLLMAAFVCVLLCANLVGVSKAVTIAGFTFGALRLSTAENVPPASPPPISTRYMPPVAATVAGSLAAPFLPSTVPARS